MDEDNRDEANPGQQINIELGEKEAEGTYSNLAIISHSPAEFIIDFTRIFPGSPKAKVHSRIVMTPQHAKLFLNAMKENIGRYEKQYGEIPLMNEQNTGAMGFQLPGPPKEEKIN
ncbi:MAG: DUF3467 domain-containing protein [Ignavibacteria bacterium]|nr:DUF3467 domain-containing protein [Ignavibacteria bacterium]